MATNPLFPGQNNSSGPDQTGQSNAGPVPVSGNPAADLIRQKLGQIYAQEPDVNQELLEAEAPPRHLSKHQKFMQELSDSGKSLAEVQTEWHNYYVSLPDAEKHQVWQEFYDANQNNATYNQVAQPSAPAQPRTDYSAVIPLEPAGQKPVVADHAPTHYPHQKDLDKRSPKQIRNQLRDKISASGKLTTKHHLQSLGFGIASGLIVVVIFLFGFFNEFFIAPFIQPNRNASATPVILDASSVTVGSTPEVIIPKINVEIPVDYSQTTTDESQIENALNSGVVHYPTTVQPGQQGNAAFFGHSSNNIFNSGKYKFAFVLLHELVPGDTFYLTKDGKAYVYQVISKTVVPPTQVSVLGPVDGQVATATLITCDPPGTSLNRLVVVGKQISPDPSGDSTAPTPAPSTSQTVTTNLPGNGPTLWSRFWHWVF